MTTRGPADLLFIIPAFNEEEALPGVLTELAGAYPDADVVVIDDGSSDATAAVAREGGAVVLQLPYNLGIGGALRTGFRYAVRKGYQRGVQFDADGQHHPDEVPALLAGLDAGADMVVGSRFSDGRPGYKVGRLRKAAMGVLTVTMRRIAGKDFSDTSSGFRAFSRPVLEFFADTYPAEYMESVEALFTTVRAGYDVVEVPVTMRNRELGAPSNRTWRLVYHYLRLFVVLLAAAPRSRRPGPPPADAAPPGATA
ncbi:MAG: glycosyltransferase family 2 protein [Acidimicrobiales bacterium]|nr:glycosyltransferase family 2 protein [Acidimicrobiales bacterium]